jgi:hypothetical protein
MKNLLITLLAGLLPCAALADGTPVAPASQTEVNAGTVTHKYVSPATLAAWTGAGSGPTNGITQPQLQGSLTSGTNNYAGTNATLSGTVSAVSAGLGSAIVTNTFTVGTLSAATAWVTNMVTPTNAFAGTVVDFSHAEGRTNLGGNLTFTAITNTTSGAYNGSIWHIYPGGADRTIAIPANWHSGRGDTLVVSNAFNHSDFLFTVEMGVSTNVAQRDYP